MVLTPIYQERVWGGRGLEEHLGRILPEGKTIGESWEVVDRDEAQSVVATGEFSGWTLRKVLETHPAEVMGPIWNGGRFPILVKWLDCQERLSLQVHPPAEIAPELGGEPKTENWYVAHAGAEAAILVGLEGPVTREQFAEALAQEQVESLVKKFPTRSGDSMFVPSGRIHAIDGGNLILEVQQNSDTTYRVYDWGRVGLDGKPRELHVEPSLASIRWDDTAPELIHSGKGREVLVDSDVFRLTKVTLQPGGEPLRMAAKEEPRIVSVVSGKLQETGRNLGLLMRGDNALLPFAGEFVLEAIETVELLITDRFVG